MYEKYYPCGTSRISYLTTETYSDGYKEKRRRIDNRDYPRHDLEDLPEWLIGLECLQYLMKVVGKGVNYRHILFSTHTYITKFNNKQPPAYGHETYYFGRCIIRYLTYRFCIRSRTVRLLLAVPWEYLEYCDTILFTLLIRDKRDRHPSKHQCSERHDKFSMRNLRN